MKTLNVIKTCATAQEVAEGLQNVPLGDDECCVFVFAQEKNLSFWGKNTLRDIDLCCVKGGKVCEVLPIDAMDLSVVRSSGKYDLAFECARGAVPEGSSVSMLGGRIEVC